MKFTYHLSNQYLHVGCEKPRSYYIPHSSPEGALTGIPTCSDRFLLLNGEWDFRYYPSFTKYREEDTPNSRIPVPMSWQMLTDRGYDIPQYTNLDYPFPFDPPNVPAQNPCGVYSRSFTLSSEEQCDRAIYLNLEGVDSCFYLFVNGIFAAYSQVSHCNSEIFISPYLQAGENTLKLIVLKWCDGSYLEDQDKFRLSGIFRDVYLLIRDPIHLTDIHTKPLLKENGTGGELSLHLQANGSLETLYRVLDPNGALIAEGSLTVQEEAEAAITIPAPMLWSDECPQLYTLCLQAGEEHICIPFGFRELKVVNGVVYLNGQKIKLKGVNRHDSHPILGAATPYDHMLEDLYILKRHNVNTIRSSHYPNAPMLYELCDRFGFFVCDEADLETHGAKRCGNWDYFTNGADWRESYLDRVERMYERNKNHPCILMWSLGNENGIGQNYAAMADWLHARDNTRLVHSADISRRLTDYYEKQDPSILEGYRFDYVDVESRMYTTFEECVNFHLTNQKRVLPFFLCEYSHAMGNSSGDLADYWKLIEAHDRFLGGCVWEYCDHAVFDGYENGRPRYLYGGDFGEQQHDGNFCVDGLVSPDRKPYSNLIEYKEILKPIVATSFDSATGTVTLKNKRFFASAGDLQMVWLVERRGKALASGCIELLDLHAQEEKSYMLPIGKLEDSDFTYLTLSYRQNEPTPWANYGYEIGHDQFCLSVPDTAASLSRPNRSIQVSETDELLTVRAGEQIYKFDKHEGLCRSIQSNGAELLASPIAPTVWRAPTDNDRKIRLDWERIFLDRAHSQCSEFTWEQLPTGAIKAIARLLLCADGALPVSHMTLAYTVDQSGRLTVECHSVMRDDLPMLPRFGFRFAMPKGNELLHYFGMGPFCSYVDKCHAARMGEYSTTVTEHFEHFVRPQENMAHNGTRRLAVTNLSGLGLQIAKDNGDFSFNCSHFSPEMLNATPHDSELIPSDLTFVHVDYKNSGIGSSSCGPVVLGKDYRVEDKEIDFSFTLRPIASGKAELY